MAGSKEIIFDIQALKNEPIPHLLIVLEEVERDSLGKISFNVRKRQLYLESLKELGAAVDRDIISQLVKEEGRFSRSLGFREDAETKAFNVIRLGLPASLLLLKGLAATKKLYYKRKPLFCDLFSKHDYYLSLKSSVDRKVSVEGCIKFNDREIRLKECDLVVPGEPHWFIIGNFLGIFSKNIDWKWFKQALQEEEFLLSERKVEDLFDDEEENDTLPAVQWKHENMPASKSEQIQVFPVLQLTDRLGAFSNLIMDYGSGRTVEFQNPQKHVFSGDRKKQCPRDCRAEKQWENDLLETDFIVKQVGCSHYYCPLDKVSKSLTFLLECGWTIKDSRGRKIIRQEASQISLSVEEQSIVVRGKISYGDHQANLSQVIGAFNRRENFIELSSEASGLLSYQFFEKEIGRALIEGEVVGDGVKVKKSHLGTLADLWEPSNHIQQLSLDSSMQKLRHRMSQLAESESLASEDYPPSSSFQGVLRPYQQQGVNWLHFLKEFGFHGILADDMGLGKTVQVLAFISSFDFEVGLIIAPTSLLFNWRQEIEKFLPGINVIVHRGSSRLTDLKKIPRGTLLLTSYPLLRIDRELFANAYFDIVVLDEAQAIKNADTKSSRAACSLKAGYRLCLTGTPIENRLQDIWGQFQFLMPELLGTRQEFQKQIESAEMDIRFIQRLKKKIRPFMLRRTKKEVAKDLPEKIEQVVWVEMSSYQRRIYEELISGVRTNLLKKVTTDGLSAHRIEVFESILRLRQICCHPLLIGSSFGPDIDEDEIASGKWEVLIADLKTIVEENRKALVYSQFTSMLQLIAKTARQEGWNSVYLDGSTKNREEVVKQFQEDPSVNLFFISLKAGGVGLNLTSADYVILYDPWWNEAVENQAIDRAHRIGRVEPVIAKRLVTVESIEEKMMKLKSAKKTLTESLWEGELELSALTEEDFAFLIGP